MNNRTPSNSRAHVLAYVLPVVFLTVVGGLWVPAASGSPVSGRYVTPLAPSSIPLAAATRAVQQYANSTGVFTETSLGAYALLGITTPTGQVELVLFNGLRNVSKVVQGPEPVQLTPNSMVAAGGHFYVQWQNSTSGKETFEVVTTNGVTAIVKLPLTKTISWTLIYGDASHLLAAAPGALAQVNPATNSLVADYSSFLPSNVSFQSAAVAPFGFYLGGAQSAAIGGARPFAGWFDTTTDLLTDLTPTVNGAPGVLTGSIDSIALAGNEVYFGGYLAVANFSAGFFEQIVGGYLFGYSTLSTRFQNLSAILPASTPAVFGVFPVGRAVVLNTASFLLNVTGSTFFFTQSGGTYVVSGVGTRIKNDTALTGVDFVALLTEASESGGFYFVGGSNLTSGLAQVEAIRLSAL
ncbi:MAG TPA: hypothetical protein VEY07_00920 [Thermoplasmata archaeon]|nr:hypothetical protein [Thermoplasmata archaeon]